MVLDENITVSDIGKQLPLNLNMVRYAGHIYYWDGWNAFVINYVDYDISPYEVVHIGEITDKSICDVLENGNDNISIYVEELNESGK